MTDWAPNRFWKTASVVETDQGLGIALDSRSVRTPSKAALIVPTRAMANAIAAEWDAQDGKVNPFTMPVTRSANAAIDKVARQRAEVVEMLSAYGDSDLLCYRADSPVELAEREAIAWDPVLEWASATLGARLEPRQGIIHKPQSPAALAELQARVHRFSTFELTAFHDLVSLTGSLVLGFAATHAHRPPEEVWALSRIDEVWQEELWGADEEAQEDANRKKNAFLHAYRFFLLATTQ